MTSNVPVTTPVFKTRLSCFVKTGCQEYPRHTRPVPVFTAESFVRRFLTGLVRCFVLICVFDLPFISRVSQPTFIILSSYVSLRVFHFQELTAETLTKFCIRVVPSQKMLLIPSFEVSFGCTLGERTNLVDMQQLTLFCVCLHTSPNNTHRT